MVKISEVDRYSMQSEEIAEPKKPSQTSNITSEMTFSDSRDSPSVATPTDFICPEIASDFDGINLEDDIEKIEESSLDSASTVNEDDVSKPCTESIPTADILRGAPVDLNGLPSQPSSESIKHWLQRITSIQQEVNKKGMETHNIPSPSRVVKYQDLPYMGEMTLDNCKPRRGRKPKKADICHLIYKNYGTILPGTPNSKIYTDKDVSKRPEINQDLAKTDVQNRIISSLLERRLTQEHRHIRNYYCREEVKHRTDNDGVNNQNEPMNLCIRDLNHLNIRLHKNEDVTDTLEIKSELPTPEEDSDIFTKTPSPGFETKYPLTPEGLLPPGLDISKPPENGAGPGGYVYWPSAGIFIHPMALQHQLMYYQKLISNNSYTLPGLVSKSPVTTSSTPPPTSQELRKIAPKLKPKEKENEPGQESKTKRNASSGGDKTPAKRKRSAIFIPPIQTENNTNPATEVSICKFKFTGGAKPSLQEKKMLSVDSGGNFRYYSGTGDKSTRGYEFFPREALQQQANASPSSTGAFLQASGERIYPPPQPDLLLGPPTPVGIPVTGQDRAKAKRRSKRSAQREKLEQTFKEKGFLIQTQQLESAEGATYCKFRQLRKFTRYLFRSWKDYLPGNVRELQPGTGEQELDQQESTLEALETLSASGSSGGSPAVSAGTVT